MALVLEDGSCVPTANAWITRAFLISFAADYYPATTVPDDETTDGAILRATAWLSSFPNWDGKLACGRGEQGTSMPRTGMIDCNGDAVASNSIPSEAVHACCIASLAELSDPGILSPTITPGEQAKKEKVDVIEVEYMTPKDQGAIDGTTDPAQTLRPVLTLVSDLLKCLASFPNGKNTPWPFVA